MQTSEHTDITNLIGALELDRSRIAIDDASLENSAGNIYAGPSSIPANCGTMGIQCLTKSTGCHFIDDAALENSAGALYAGPSSSPAMCTRMRLQNGQCL